MSVTSKPASQANPSAWSLRQRQIIITISRIWAWLFLAGLILFFTISVSIVSGGDVNFLTIRNSQNVLVAITPVLLMGLGQTFVIIAAGIDLSVGWVMGLASVVSALVMRDLATHMTVEVAIFVGFLAGAAAAAFVGFINGLMIARLKMPSFIITLGMSFIARGVAYLLSGGNVVGGLPPESAQLRQ